MAGPVFIVGCGRSGTTLLRVLLNRHSNIAIPGETWFFPELDARRDHVRSLAASESGWRQVVAEHVCGFATFAELGVDRAAVRSLLQETDITEWPDVVAVANRAYARSFGKPRWGDKTPGYVRHLPLIRDLYPEAVVLNMVRDGRDVAVSFLEMPFGPTTVMDAAAWWTADVCVGRRLGPELFGDRYMEVRYEELVSRPEALLEEICDLLGEPFEAAMMDQDGASGPHRLEEHWWHELTEKPITEQRIGRWREELTSVDAHVFELESGGLLKDLGYDTSGPSPVHHHVVWVGRRVGRRVARFARRARERVKGRVASRDRSSG